MSYKKSEALDEFVGNINSWLKDFNKTQPRNVMIDDDTFEGSACHLLTTARGWLKEWREELENVDQ